MITERRSTGHSFFYLSSENARSRVVILLPDFTSIKTACFAFSLQHNIVTMKHHSSYLLNSPSIFSHHSEKRPIVIIRS